MGRITQPSAVGVSSQDAAQNEILAVLQQNLGSIRVGNGAATDELFQAAGGTIPASTAQSPMWIDRETGTTYWRDGATNAWLQLGTGASVPTFSYPLLLGSSSYADFETKAAGSTLVPVARIFEQTSAGLYNMPTYAGSNLATAMATPGRSYVWSCKPTMANMVAQTAGLSTDINNFLSALVAAIGAVGTARYYLCIHHEPCPDYNPADFKAAFEWWADKIIALGRPDIIPTCIFRGNGDFETSGLNNTHLPTSQPPASWGGTETIYSWFPDVSYANDVVIGFDPYSYWPGRVASTTTSNDRSLRHLMRIILPAIRARGFLRWGIAENGIQMVQTPTPQNGGGDPPSTSTPWTDQDRLDRWTGAQAQYRNQNLGGGTAHPGYLAWLVAQAGPFPDPATASVTNPYDSTQTAATQYGNPGQAYDAGSNGCEYYCYFNEEQAGTDWQGEYTITAAMADALLTAAAGL